MSASGCLSLTVLLAGTAMFLWGAYQPKPSERDQICAATEYC